MYKIIYMKADYEPWWQFEGWEEHIISESSYDDEQAFQDALSQLVIEFRARYENETCKQDRFYAFWSDDETEFCEACDDDAQIYHGIIVSVSEGIQI